MMPNDEDIFFDEPLVDHQAVNASPIEYQYLPNSTYQPRMAESSYQPKASTYEPKMAETSYQLKASTYEQTYQPEVSQYQPSVDAPKPYDAPVKEEKTLMEKLLESSRNQEKLLTRLVCEMEQMNLRMVDVSRKTDNKIVIEALDKVERVIRKEPTPPSTPMEPRGTMVLPPGSRPVVALPVNTDESKEKEERLMETRRAAETARLVRIEAERKAKEAEEEQRRAAEIKRMEEEKKAKEELEKKTRGLMSGLLTGGGNSLFDNDDELIATKPKGLFDD